MSHEYASYSEAANAYGDAHRLAQTADAMGAPQTAQGWRDEAEQIRQGFFGPDPKPKR